MSVQSKKYFLFLSLLSPLIGIFSLFKIKKDKFLVFAGTIIMGLLGSIYIYVPGSDGHTHRNTVINEYIGLGLSEIIDKTHNIITFQSSEGIVDLYLHSLAVITGSFLGLPDLLHVFAGLVYGFFYTSSVLLVLRNLPHQKSLLVIGFVALFLIYRSVTGLNSIRMWTGFWVLFYGIYSWYIHKEKKYLLIAYSSVFIHFSYIVLLLPVVSAPFLNKMKLIVAMGFLLSFSSSLNIYSLESYVPNIGVLQERKNATINYMEYQESVGGVGNESDGNVRFYREFGEKYYRDYSIVFISLIMLLFFYFRNDVSREFELLFATGLLLYAFGNFFEFSASLSGRSKSLASIFLLSSAIYILLNFNFLKAKKSLQRVFETSSWVFLISTLPVMLFHISYFISMISFSFFIFAPISWFLGNEDFSIRELIGFIL